MTGWDAAPLIAGNYCGRNTMRRDLKQLDKQFLAAEIAEASERFHRVAWAKHRQLMLTMWGNTDDVNGELDLVLVRLATQFDHTKGKPFIAYALGRLQHVLIDANRRRYGRIMADMNRDNHPGPVTAADAHLARVCRALDAPLSLTHPDGKQWDIAALSGGVAHV